MKSVLDYIRHNNQFKKIPTILKNIRWIFFILNNTQISPATSYKIIQSIIKLNKFVVFSEKFVVFFIILLYSVYNNSDIIIK